MSISNKTFLIKKLPWWINSETCTKSFSFKFLDVKAGDPILRPLGLSALLSPGQVFLFKAILISSKTFSARAPSIPLGRKSTNIKWLSVPPEIIIINVRSTELIIIIIVRSTEL